MVNPIAPVRSVYWEYKAKDIAQEHNEACRHINNSLPKVKFKYKTSEDNFNLKFRVTCRDCKVRCPVTEILLRRKFLEFYANDET